MVVLNTCELRHVDSRCSVVNRMCKLCERGDTHCLTRHGRGSPMLGTINRYEEQTSNDNSALMEMIRRGTILSGVTWTATEALLVTEIEADHGRYYKATIADTAGSVEAAELSRLERELGKNLVDCVVSVARHERPHRAFYGSKSFNVVTIYGG